MSETFAHSGAWGVAAIMIVVASWAYYRYFAPKAWRDWPKFVAARRLDA